MPPASPPVSPLAAEPEPADPPEEIVIEPLLETDILKRQFQTWEETVERAESQPFEGSKAVREALTETDRFRSQLSHFHVTLSGQRRRAEQQLKMFRGREGGEFLGRLNEAIGFVENASETLADRERRLVRVHERRGGIE